MIAEPHPAALGTAGICNTLVRVQQPYKDVMYQRLKSDLSTLWSLCSTQCSEAQKGTEAVISAHTPINLHQGFQLKI